jgi:hypothetical protein
MQQYISATTNVGASNYFNPAIPQSSQHCQQSPQPILRSNSKALAASTGTPGPKHANEVSNVLYK